ncbi:MAG: hypothetical protein LBT37_05115 [Lactobacillaceae bacterium]|jgi:hypothetical protein|nr:hypothetical protein [Lactobacillaceae bacterium]
MKKQDKLAKKTAVKMTKDIELSLKRGLIHVELMDSPEKVEAFLKEDK